jgi:hypothetical protein
MECSRLSLRHNPPFLRRRIDPSNYSHCLILLTLLRTFPSSPHRHLSPHRLLSVAAALLAYHYNLEMAGCRKSQTSPATSVVLIDGSKNHRTYWADQLKRCSADYLIVGAGDRESGLELYRPRRIDCVVLELSLPDQSDISRISSHCQQASCCCDCPYPNDTSRRVEAGQAKWCVCVPDKKIHVRQGSG